MIEQLPAWIRLPSRSIRQTEIFGQWCVLIRERIIQNPPLFLCHLSSAEIRATLAAAERTAAMPDAKLTPFVVQILAYERQVQKMLKQTGVTLEEAEGSMAAAQQELV
jgi:hypothetical protein